MIALEDIKSVATPKDVARHFLGQPRLERGDSLWYCSPFRTETHPSFKVDSIGMYDFGTNYSYDIFGFVQKLKGCSFKESVELLASMYGISERNYESEKLVRWLRQKQAEEEQNKRKAEWFYLRVWDEVEKEENLNNECLEVFKGDFSDDTYKTLIDRQVSIEGEKEYLVEQINTWQDKQQLLDKAMKGELPLWLQQRIGKYIMSFKRFRLRLSPRLKF